VDSEAVSNTHFLCTSVSNKPISNSNKLLIVLALTIISCRKTTKLDSDELSTTSERVEILKKEIRCFSEIKDAEFECIT
jgi:hypothetical protein